MENEITRADGRKGRGAERDRGRLGRVRGRNRRNQIDRVAADRRPRDNAVGVIRGIRSLAVAVACLVLPGAAGAQTVPGDPVPATSIESLAQPQLGSAGEKQPSGLARQTMNPAALKAAKDGSAAAPGQTKKNPGPGPRVRRDQPAQPGRGAGRLGNAARPDRRDRPRELHRDGQQAGRRLQPREPRPGRPDRPEQLRGQAQRPAVRPPDRLGPAGEPLVLRGARLRRPDRELPPVRMVQDLQPDPAPELQQRRQLVPVPAVHRLRHRRLPQARHERQAPRDRQQRVPGQQLPDLPHLGLREAARGRSELRRAAGVLVRISREPARDRRLGSGIHTGPGSVR